MILVQNDEKMVDFCSTYAINPSSKTDYGVKIITWIRVGREKKTFCIDIGVEFLSEKFTS